MQNILIPIKINGERRRWNGSALSAASGGQPSATQRDIITHLWLKEISLDFLEFFWWQCLFWQTKQPSTTQRDISTHFWLRKCKYFNLNFPRIFWVEKKTALCCPQTRGTLRKQYCIVLHIVKQGVPSCLHSCDNVATRCVSESLSSVSIFRTNLTWKSCAVIIWLALTAPCRANKSYNKQSLEKTQLEGVENYLDKFIPFYWHCDPSYKE